MPDWDPKLYLKFEHERGLPCRDLVAKIELRSPSFISDIGCGPGNSASVLAERWPGAEIVGVDNSPEMLSKARASTVKAEWVQANIRDWTPDRPCDLIFSNAALQWLEDHDTLIPRLFGLVAPGGAFAFQVPAGDADSDRAIRDVAGRPGWRGRFQDIAVDLNRHVLSYYYDLLSPLAERVDLWQTQYVHVFPGPASIVEWERGTGLRPFLERLPDNSERETFLSESAEEIGKIYPLRADGRVLFPFLRRFVVAYR